MHWRRQKRQPETLNKADDLDFTHLAAAALDPQADPTQALGLSDMVDQLLGRLDEIDGRLLQLLLQGCNSVEIGSRLNLDSRFVRVRLSRLRKRLRNEGQLDDTI